MNRATGAESGGLESVGLVGARDPLALGTLGTQLTPPEYRLFSEKVKLLFAPPQPNPGKTRPERRARGEGPPRPGRIRRISMAGSFELL